MGGWEGKGACAHGPACTDGWDGDGCLYTNNLSATVTFFPLSVQSCVFSISTQTSESKMSGLLSLMEDKKVLGEDFLQGREKS